MQAGIEPRSADLEDDAFTTRPTRRFMVTIYMCYIVETLEEEKSPEFLRKRLLIRKVKRNTRS